MNRNILLYPYFQFFRNLLFWQAIWFLYFESVVSASQAIILIAIVDLSTVILEIPSGYFSDYLGRRLTLIIGLIASAAGCLLLFGATSFTAFAIAQILLGAGNAFVSGTDNALLYDSLDAQNRQSEFVKQEVRAWRYSYAALAISAIAGGYLSSETYRPVYLITSLALIAALGIIFLFREPTHPQGHTRAASPWRQMATVWSRIQDRTLFWILAFSVSAYVLSHVPYVFAQPYLKETLAKIGYAPDTPLIVGIIIAAMMVVSAMASAFILPLRKYLGTIGNLLIAMSMQIALILMLAFLIHPAVVFLLVLRMVPDALSRPIILEIIHPRIESGYRATYLSLQNLLGRLALSGSLLLTAWLTSGTENIDETALRTILPYYGAVGLIVLAILAMTAFKSLEPIEKSDDIA